MIHTLQLYITRELIKTFALTAIGLTLVFSLCGGVFNMIKADVLTTVQLIRILLFVLPIAATLTLPVSALFACAIVYGRLAADNEIDACRASGININRLLKPALGLSVFTALFTYLFANHLIPRFIEQLDALVRGDLQKMVYQTLVNRGYGKYRDFVLYAQDIQLNEDEASGIKTIQLNNTAFLELERDTLTRCGTAKGAEFDFQTQSDEKGPAITAKLHKVRLLDIDRGQLFEDEVRPFDPMYLPTEMKVNPKWLTLPQLLYYRNHPLELPHIRDQVNGLRLLAREAQFYQYVAGQLTTGQKVLRLDGKETRYEIRAQHVRPRPENLQPDLIGVKVTEFEGKRKRSYQAKSAKVKVIRQGASGTPALSITLDGQVVMTDSEAPGTKKERPKWDLDRILLPSTLPGMPGPATDDQLVGNTDDLNTRDEELPSLNLGTRLDDVRHSDRASIFAMEQNLAGLIHSRLAFSVSTLVILILAAALGIIVRGGQLLTAFAISFVPGMLVVVMNIMGRQMSGNPGTHTVGLCVIWSGIAIVALADVVVLTRFLKR